MGVRDFLPEDTVGQVAWAVICALGAAFAFAASGTEDTDFLIGIGRLAFLLAGVVLVCFAIENVSALRFKWAMWRLKHMKREK